MDSGAVLEVELMGFGEGLDMEGVRMRGVEPES